ncbi:DNA methyltransferase [Actinoplanes sp. NEAU-A12]|uniref:Methyltransferase n=1 Tax=Actinoplanes sandaracinus TaxID=3045177 RepID=A0ABT6WNA8_9ACTN|nr:DNA methyltransferase [Actinoplanes sandaracinus]MDI6101203.1 DNA methyltransferase [Actinoplanes sandaracinus]
MSESPTIRATSSVVPGFVPAPRAASTTVPESIPGVGANPTAVPAQGAGSVAVPTPVPVPGSVPAAVPTTVPRGEPAPAPPAEGPTWSVWLTGQQPSRELRRGRYTPESITHPGKMLPTIARYAIHTYTDPGDLVLDPMAGIGTTMVEAMHLDRHGVGVEYESRWAALAAVNIALAEKHGAPGTGAVYTGDSRHLPSLLPPQIRGQVALVITSPPYGSSTHGHARTPGARRGKVRKIHHRYGGSDNLAYRNHGELAEGFTEILTGCRAVLRPGGHVVVTARPYRRHGELVDIPGMVVAAGEAAGLELVEECVALMAGVRNGVLVPRASFFQQKNVRDAIASGDPQWIPQHEDVLILRVGLR